MSSLNAAVVPLPVRRQQERTGYPFPSQRIALSHLGGTRFVSLSEIMYMTAAGAYTLLTLNGGERITVSKPMSRFEDRIVSPWFYRIHKSYILNISYFREYLCRESDTAVMSNGDKIQISRNKVASFLQAVEEVTGCIKL